MGYTHYWKHNGISIADWHALTLFAHGIIDMASVIGIKLAIEFDDPTQQPDINEAEIRFNGVGDEGHETFFLTREKTDFDFCKTERKPYDAVVAEILSFASHCIDGFSTSHD